MMILKLLSSSPLFSSKSLKYNNYGKAPYVASSYRLSKPIRQAIHFLPIQANSPHLQQHTNKHFLICTFPRFWPILKAILTDPYNQGTKVQVTTKNV